MLNYLLTRNILTEEQLIFLKDCGYKTDKVCEIMSEIFYRIVTPDSTSLQLDLDTFDQCVFFSKVSDSAWDLVIPEEAKWQSTKMPGSIICDQLEKLFLAGKVPA